MKFRVWDKSVNFMDDRVRITTVGNDVKVEVLDAFTQWRKLEENQYELMQSLNLKDKNGNEVYEGDILTDEGSFEGDSWDYGTVKFDKDEYTFYIDWKNEEILESITNCEDYSIAGNIYENKELTEV